MSLVSPDVVADLARKVNGDARAAAKRDMAVRSQAFDEWVQGQAMGGAGGLHAISRLPAGWHASPFDKDTSNVPFCLGGEVDQLQREWSSWWRVSFDQVPLRWPADKRVWGWSPTRHRDDCR